MKNKESIKNVVLYLLIIAVLCLSIMVYQQKSPVPPASSSATSPAAPVSPSTKSPVPPATSSTKSPAAPATSSAKPPTSPASSSAKPPVHPASPKEIEPAEQRTPPVTRDEDNFVGYWKSTVPVSQRKNGFYWDQCVIIEKNGSALLVTVEEWQKGSTQQDPLTGEYKTYPTRVSARPSFVGNMNNGVLSIGRGLVKASFIIDQDTHQLRWVEENVSYVKGPREKSPPLIEY